MQTRPDVLVLGAGGPAGVGWLTGVLAGIEDRSGVSFAQCECILGTSAGAVVAARLATGERLQRPAGEGPPQAPAPPGPSARPAHELWGEIGLIAAAPFALFALRLGARPG
ncbi:MAG: hypothetical protein ACRDKL_12330, partial [Solirubrobacteraceae bacterium]